MLKRTLSTLALWGLVSACVYFFGHIGGVILIAAVAVLTLREFYALIEKLGVQVFDKVGMLLAAVMTLAPWALEPYCPVRAELVLALGVVLFSVRILGERDPQNRVETLGWSLFGLVYVPFMLQYLVRIVIIDQPHANSGMVLAIWVIAASKFCDTGALLCGMAFGRHKMSPVISPKKTWEGAIGGVLISAGVSAGYAALFSTWLPASFTPLVAALMAVPIAVLAIVSDLIESVIKRRVDTKDTGQAIPGIGGIFDLSDSLILTAPVGYALIKLL